MSALFLLLLAGQAAVHVAPPMPENHVHLAPAGMLKTCPVAPVIPAELAGWRTAMPVAAGDTPAVIQVGQGARATLLPGAEVNYSLVPEKPGAAGTSGGVFAFEVARAGTYRVALGAGAWIDVVRGGAAIASKAHGHGPDCSPVKKMVDFDLTPGRYVLQIAGSPTPTLALIVARLG